MAKPIRIQLLRTVSSPYFLPICRPNLFAHLPRSQRGTRAALSTSGRTKQIQLRFSRPMTCATRDSSPIPTARSPIAAAPWCAGTSTTPTAISNLKPHFAASSCTDSSQAKTIIRLIPPLARIFHRRTEGTVYGVPALAGQTRPRRGSASVSSRRQGTTPCRLKPGLHAPHQARVCYRARCLLLPL